MRKQGDTEGIGKLATVDRLAIAFMSAGFGFLTGMIIWFAIPRAFDTSFSAFFWLSVVLAAVFSFVGFFNPNFASSALGGIWSVVSVINRKIFFWIRLIK